MLRVLLISKSKPLIDFCRKNTPEGFEFKAAGSLNLRNDSAPGIIIFDSGYLVQHTDAIISAAAQKFGVKDGGVSLNIFMHRNNRTQAFSLFPENLRHVHSIVPYDVEEGHVRDLVGAEWRWFLESSARRLKYSSKLTLFINENKLLTERLSNLKPLLKSSMPFPAFMHGKSLAITRFREQVLAAATGGAFLLLKTKEDIPAEEFLEYYCALLRPEETPQFRVIDLEKIPRHLHAQMLFPQRNKRKDPRRLLENRRERAGQAEVPAICVQNLQYLTLPNQAQLLSELSRQRDGAEKHGESRQRFVFIANGELSRAVKRGAFRQELYSLLKRRVAEMPPLYERAEDITHIAAEHISRHEFSALGPDATEIAAKILARFDLSSGYKGLFMTLDLMHDLEKSKGVPVFELLNAAQKSDAFIAAQSFLREQTEPSPVTLFQGLAGGEKEALSLEDVERNYIAAVCERYGWQVTDAARHLRISRKTLYDKMRRYKLERPEKQHTSVNRRPDDTAAGTAKAS